MDEDELDRIERMYLAQGVKPFHLLQAKAHLAGMRAIDLEKNVPTPDAVRRLSAAICRQHSVVPVIVVEDRTRDEVLVIAVADASNFAGLDAVREACGCKVQPVLAAREQITAALTALDTAED